MSKITRTFTTSVLDIVFYSKEEDTVKHIPYRVAFEDVNPGKFNLKTVNSVPGLIPVCVFNVEKTSVLYGMDESLFIENATKADKRGPETRDCVTKEVHVFVADCLVFNNETFKVEEKALSVPGNMDKDKAKEKLNKAAKGYTVVNVKAIREEIGLYYMPVADFVRLAEIIDK